MIPKQINTLIVIVEFEKQAFIIFNSTNIILYCLKHYLRIIVFFQSLLLSSSRAPDVRLMSLITCIAEMRLETKEIGYGSAPDKG